MKTTIKKIIAREFLILISTTVVYFIIILLWLFGINQHKNKVDHLISDSESLRISLSPAENQPTLNESLMVLYNRSKERFDFKEDEYHYYNLLYSDTATLKRDFEYVKSKGYSKNIDQFKVLLGLDEASFGRYLRYQEMNKKISAENQIITNAIAENDKVMRKLSRSFFHKPISTENYWKLGVILIAVSFLSRYIFYAVKWSLLQMQD
ncbi:MAG: hypothetical protein WEC59_09160 [Salibacteraceae bacterium]